MALKFKRLVLCLLAAMAMGEVMADQHSAEFIYIQNKGQFRDQNGNGNSEVIAAAFSEQFDLLIRENGFSYQLKENKNGQIHFHRVDIVFENRDCLNTAVEFSDLENEGLNFISDDFEVSDVHRCKRIIIRNLYAGIDLEFTSVIDESGNFIPKYNIILEHASLASKMRMNYRGASSTSGDATGKSIDIETSLTSIVEKIPVSYLYSTQELIDVSFKRIDHDVFGYVIYDEIPDDSKLIIDPIPSPAVTWSTYFGGTAAEQGLRTAIDGMGGVYLGGITSSNSGIATAGAHQGTYGGTPFNDVFIAKFDITGNRIWSTYYGGAQEEQLGDMAVDVSGNIYFTGSSVSTSSIASAGAFQTTNAGNGDAILVKLNASGNRLWGTYYGGPLNDSGRGITINGASVCIVGQTASMSGINTAGGLQLVYGGGTSDCFIAEFTTGGVLNWATYYGGSGVDVGYGIRTDAASNYYIVSTTNSSGLATSGAFQVAPAGSNDILITALSSSGSMIWSTYYGGSLADSGYAIEVDISGDILITGQTNSTTGIATPGANDTALGGPTDGFVVSFSSAGTRNWGTYIGGNIQDIMYDLFTDGLGNVFIAGNSNSTTGLSTAGANQSVYGGGSADAVISCFDLAGTVKWISYFGGSGDDYARSLVTDQVSELYVAGFTSSSSVISTSGAYQTSIASAGVFDAFLSDYSIAAMLPVNIVSFTAVTSDQLTVNCSWETSATESCYSYVLEKSPDSNSWQTMAEVSCDNSVDGIHYHLIDEHPFIGITYYRIKQFHNNGLLNDERNATVFLNVAEDELGIYPNPTDGLLTLNLNSTKWEFANMHVYDMTGKLVMSYNNFMVEGNNTCRLDLLSLPAGVYTVLIISSEDHRAATQVVIR